MVCGPSPAQMWLNGLPITVTRSPATQATSRNLSRTVWPLPPTTWLIFLPKQVEGRASAWPGKA